MQLMIIFLTSVHLLVIFSVWEYLFIYKMFGNLENHKSIRLSPLRSYNQQEFDNCWISRDPETVFIWQFCILIETNIKFEVMYLNLQSNQ